MRQESKARRVALDRTQDCGSRSAWILIIFRRWLRIRIRIRVKSRIRIRIKVKNPEASEAENRAVDDHTGGLQNILVIDSVQERVEPFVFLGLMDSGSDPSVNKQNNEEKIRLLDQVKTATSECSGSSKPLTKCKVIM
jgi:hypothetical protein